MEWNYAFPIKELPEKISNFFADEADYLFHELNENRLEVILIPAPEQKHQSHKIRCVQNKNPEWYRELYHSIAHFRRDRCLKALNRIRNYEDRRFRVSPYKYDYIMRELIFKRLTEEHNKEGYKIPPNKEVLTYFQIEEIVDKVPF